MLLIRLATLTSISLISLSPTAGAEPAAGRWWEKAAAIRRVTLKPGRGFHQLSLEPARLSEQLDEMRRQGFDVAEIFAPADGGWSYSGLDAKNRYQIDPEAGTMDDFRRLVRTAHAKGMAIISFDNLGYSSVEAPHFLKACDDVREGRSSRESKWFLWSERADAPPPAAGDTYFMVRPLLPGYESEKHEFWQYSDRAKRFYWTKWGGVDSAQNKVRLPQYNWASPEWQDEAGRIVRFWMDTGIDGMVVDAVNWYVGYTWAIGKKQLTNVISSYGPRFSQPEGAGGFHEDPVAWITEGGWNCVQDYGLGIWWEEGNNVLHDAIQNGDPRPVETALRDYHDRVVAAGGVLYFEPPRFDDPARQHLSVAALAGFGDLMFFGEKRGPQKLDEEVAWILRAKAEHPALHQLGIRRKLPVRASERHYAFLRTPPDGGERMLVVLNFQDKPQTVDVDLSGLAASTITDLKTAERHAVKQWFQVSLPAFGYRFYKVEERGAPRLRYGAGDGVRTRDVQLGKQNVD